MAVRCVIVDDNGHFLDAARGLLERQGVAVVGVASNGADALRRADELQPDVMLVDIDLCEESGFDVTLRLAAGEGEPVPVILISAYAEKDFADLVAASPAVGFLPKSELSARAIVALLRSVGDAG
jgi:CheY-like chemotaxis protein